MTDSSPSPQAVGTPLQPADGRATPGWTGRLWTRVGGLTWSMADQLVFGGANFVLQILLARQLARAEYGAYAMINTLFFLGLAAHAALVSEPMLVFGARLASPPSEYRRAIRVHEVVGGILVVVSLVAFLLAPGGRGLGIVGAAGFVASLAGLLWNWLARRSAYLDLQVRFAAFSSITYAVILLGGLTIYPGGASLSGALWLIATAAALSALPLHVYAWRAAKVSTTKAPVSSTLRSYAAYGRWTFLTALVTWLPLNMPLLWLSLRGGLEDAAQFRAALNLTLPLLQVFGAAALYLLAAMARADAERRRRLLAMACSAIAALGIAWAFALVAAGPFLYRILYAGRYLMTVGLLLPLALIPLTEGLGYAVGAGFRAALRPSHVFFASSGGGIVLLTCVVTLAPTPVHAAWASLAGSGSTFLLLLAFLVLRGTSDHAQGRGIAHP